MDILKEIDIFEDKKHLVMNSFSTTIKDLHPNWVEDCLGDAPHFYTITKEQVPKPYVVILESFGGELSKSDFFVINERCKWRVKCLLFENNENKRQWIEAVGQDKVIDEFSV